MTYTLPFRRVSCGVCDDADDADDSCCHDDDVVYHDGDKPGFKPRILYPSQHAVHLVVVGCADD